MTELHLCEVPRTGTFTETRSRMAATGLGEGDSGKSLFQRDTVLVWESSGNIGDGYASLRKYLVPLDCALKNEKLCVILFYHTHKK